MRLGKLRFAPNAGQAVQHAWQGSRVSYVSPYKDGAYPRSDANSFLAILELDAGKNKE